MKQLPKKYKHKESEKKWQQFWEENKVYQWDQSQPRDNTFVIDTPPPTVSGLLHMGHIFSYTQADLIARYQRMSGKTVFYPMGFDDNGLPTERLVEKAKKVRATDMSREDFISLCEGVSADARKEFKELFQSVALSVDWEQEYHTISEKSRKISQLSFLDLYNKNRVERKLQPMLWDTIDQTALAQAEIEDKDHDSHMNDILFGIENSDEKVIIATTRPELLAACVAVFYHPDDERYKHLEGKNAVTALFNITVPLLADENVKIDKGTGLVMCCTFGDETDINWWREHNLQTRMIVNKVGRLQDIKKSLYGNLETKAEDDVIFETENLYCRKFREDDIDLIISMHQDEEVRKYTTRGILGREQSEQWLNYLIMHQAKLGFSEWAVFEKSSGNFIGKAGPLSVQDAYYPCDLTMDSKHETTDEELAHDTYVNIEAFFKTEAWEQNYAKEFITSTIDWCFKNIPNNKFILLRNAKNQRSVDMLNSLGLTRDDNIEITHKHKNKHEEIEFISYIVDREPFYANNITPALVADNLEGLKLKKAREKTLELVKQAGLLVKQEAISHAVKCAERSGSALEIIPTNQWFIKILDQKEELKKKAAECNWYPQFMKVRIDQWIDGLSWDWCISRQRYFGVPFPIWYSKRAGEEGKVLLAEADQLPVNPLVDLPKGYSRDEVEPEVDVMDTWATSSVSPQLSSHAITKDLAIDSERHSKLFPADLRPQAHEIIRTWAFYTIVKAHLHEDEIPWKNLMISGWCLASDKTKMSKSKGNVVTPVKLIEEKGSDIVRYWASTSHLGSDTAYSEGVLKIGAKLTNKIWNASKFATLHVDKIEGTPTTASGDVANGIICEIIDKWIITRLNRTIEKATSEFEKFEYCKAREAIEDFFWNDFCDNYLEISKTRAYGELESITKEQQQSAIYTLYHCAEAILKLFAPFVPHITDEIYSHIFDDKFEKNGSLNSVGQWPSAGDFSIDETAEQAGIFVVDILNAVRKLKADKNLSIKYLLNKLAVSGEQKNGLFDSITADLAFVTNSTNVEWHDSKPEIADNCDTDDGKYNVAAVFAEAVEVA